MAAEKSKEEIDLESKEKEWIWEFMLKNCCDGRIIKQLVDCLPLPDDNASLKRMYLLRVLSVQCSTGVIDDSTLDVLRGLSELSKGGGGVGIGTKRTLPRSFGKLKNIDILTSNGEEAATHRYRKQALCKADAPGRELLLAVMVELTVQHLRGKSFDWTTFEKALETHWEGFVQDTEEQVLEDVDVSGKIGSIRSELLLLRSNPELRIGIVQKYNVSKVKEMLKSFVEKAWQYTGKTFLERVGEDVISGLYNPSYESLQREGKTVCATERDEISIDEINRSLGVARPPFSRARDKPLKVLRRNYKKNPEPLKLSCVDDEVTVVEGASIDRSKACCPSDKEFRTDRETCATSASPNILVGDEVLSGVQQSETEGAQPLEENARVPRETNDMPAGCLNQQSSTPSSPAGREKLGIALTSNMSNEPQPEPCSPAAVRDSTPLCPPEANHDVCITPPPWVMIPDQGRAALSAPDTSAIKIGEIQKILHKLQDKQADLDAVVRDPLPEILNRQTTNRQQRLMDRNASARTLEWVDDDNISESTPDSPSASRQVHLASAAARRRFSPLVGAQQKAADSSVNARLKRRRPTKWSEVEVGVLKRGVKKYGKGRWKLILEANTEAFQGRTEVDLKDKWRNLEKFEGLHMLVD